MLHAVRMDIYGPGAHAQGLKSESIIGGGQVTLDLSGNVQCAASVEKRSPPLMRHVAPSGETQDVFHRHFIRCDAVPADPLNWRNPADVWINRLADFAAAAYK